VPSGYRDPVTPTLDQPRAHKVDAACSHPGAVALALTAAQETEGAERVGEHLGFDADDERVVTHYFACLNPAYIGWRWAVTVARASRSKVITVDGVVLLPGDDSVLAPTWLPWSERLRPGDLGVGDLLPTRQDDLRLAPGFTGADLTLPDELEDPLNPPGWELGLGRVRVLSDLGRDEAADRWYSGDSGPSSPMAQAAPARCSSCGFLVPVSGVMRQAFGVCANEMSPSDGRIVSLDHGCGAHSEAQVQPVAQSSDAPIVDEVGFDVIAVHGEQTSGSIDASAPTEELGHS